MSTQIKERPIIFNTAMVQAILNGSKSQSRRVIKPQPVHVYLSYSGRYHFNGVIAKHPYRLGSRLWVRETWLIQEKCWVEDHYEPDGRTIYKADKKDPNYFKGYWKPSIHMPRWASRITLEITEEKAARTQDLTLAEAIAEGYHSIEEANREFLKLAHLPEGSNGWNWVITFKKEE